MSGKDGYRRSKVTTRYSVLDGIFEQSSEEIDFLDWVKDKNWPTNEVDVKERLNYFTAYALAVLQQRCGFNSWSDKVLFVDGKRQPLPPESELPEYLLQLKAEGKATLQGTARSAHEELLSFGNLANRLDKACGAVQIAIDRNDMFYALSALIRAESIYLNLRLLAMENDYVHGKAQRDEHGTDWVKVLIDWDLQRFRYPSARQCDLAMAEKYGIKYETLKSYRTIRLRRENEKKLNG